MLLDSVPTQSFQQVTFPLPGVTLGLQVPQALCSLNQEPGPHGSSRDTATDSSPLAQQAHPGTPLPRGPRRELFNLVLSSSFPKQGGPSHRPSDPSLGLCQRPFSRHGDAARTLGLGRPPRPPSPVMSSSPRAPSISCRRPQSEPSRAISRCRGRKIIFLLRF